MKKVGKYIIITLLLLLGLFCVGLLYLFFVPGSNLFSICYISYNESTESKYYNPTEVNKVILKTNNYNVEIVETTSPYISVKLHNNSFGYVLEKNKFALLEDECKNGILTVDITEPSGLAFKNNSYVKLYLPKNTDELDVELKNNHSRTTIDSSSIVIDSLNYTSVAGDFFFEQGKVNGDIFVNTEKADFRIYEKVTTNNNNVTIKIKSGEFNAENSILGNVNIESNERGRIVLNECAKIEEFITLAGGQIKANKVNSVHVITSDTIINIDEITAEVSIELTKSGSVNISKFAFTSNACTSDITTADGNIIINKSNSSLLLRSGHGNITVNNAYKLIDAKTSYSGNITVNYASDATNYEEDAEGNVTSTSRTLIAATKNGTITATGVDHASVSILHGGAGKANVTFNKLIGKNFFTSDEGNFDIKLEDPNNVFVLNTNVASNNSRINLKQTPVFNGWTDSIIENEPINCSSVADTKNLLNVQIKGSGSLTILDKTFY